MSNSKHELLTEGWATMHRAQSCHYFRDGKTLCGKSGTPMSRLQPDLVGIFSHCHACARKVFKITRSKFIDPETLPQLSDLELVEVSRALAKRFCYTNMSAQALTYQFTPGVPCRFCGAACTRRIAINVAGVVYQADVCDKHAVHDGKVTECWPEAESTQNSSEGSMLFRFKGFWDCESECEIAFFRGPLTGWSLLPSETADIVVMATELPDNNGTSITNMAENLAVLACREFHIDPSRMLWIEHYPDRREDAADEAGAESWELVTFLETVQPDGISLHSPQWRRLRPDELSTLTKHAVQPEQCPDCKKRFIRQATGVYAELRAGFEACPHCGAPLGELVKEQ